MMTPTEAAIIVLALEEQISKSSRERKLLAQAREILWQEALRIVTEARE
jgi:hypothetical protein